MRINTKNGTKESIGLGELIAMQNQIPKETLSGILEVESQSTHA
jgi:hypothetical protein